MTRPAYHPHPRHFYEDRAGVVHLCDASEPHPGVYLAWTLCGRMDAPADQSFMSDRTVADCASCRQKADAA